MISIASPWPRNVSAQLKLDFVPGIQHLRSPRDREQRQDQTFHAWHFHRPVEPDGQHDHQAEEANRTGHDAYRVSKKGRARSTMF